jgi:serine/threonine protein kinase
MTYRVEKDGTKEQFILKTTAILPNPKDSVIIKSDNSIFERKKEIEEKKRKFEELLLSWKLAMMKSENIVKLVSHWYDDADEYSFIVMEYCPGGDLAEEIQQRIKDHRKFTEKV